MKELGRLFRWLPCDVCGSRDSERVLIELDGQRVLCVHVAACEERARRIPTRALERRRRMRAVG